jgi:mono/diheme cytochrome c family protein
MQNVSNRRRLAKCLFMTWLTITLLVSVQPVVAQNSAVRRQARLIEQAIDRAGKAYSSKDFAESGRMVSAAQTAMEMLVANPTPDVVKLLQPQYERLKKAHGLLQLEGVDLEPLGGLQAVLGEDAGMPVDGGTSFAKEVVPILVGKCGRCHVTGNRGDFAMRDYTELMRGTTAGRVVLPGNGEGSRIYQVIEEGDMPRGGGRVTDDELALLKKWIDEGARVDPQFRSTSLVVLNADNDTAKPAMPEPELVQATGKETVSFALDVAPVIVQNCGGCHVNAQNARGGLNLTMFQGWLRGGDSGNLFVPGNPDESLLVQKLKGTAGGDRMPQNRPPLPDETIEKIATWIKEGATFDGREADQTIELVFAEAKAQKATHDELLKDRVALAHDNWDLGLPNVDAAEVETDNFLVIGNVGQDQLEEIGRRAEALAPGVARMFRGNTRTPFVKGRMTIFVFRSRYDYSEFGKMVEKRQLPQAWKGHWRYNILDNYAALLPPRGAEDEMDGLLIQQLGSGYMAGLGQGVPTWFADGAGYLAVARLVRDDPRIKEWEEALPGVIASMTKPDDFMTGKLPDDQAGLVAMSFVQKLMSDSRRFNQLLMALRKGESFDRSFQLIWGGTPQELLTGAKNQYPPGGRTQ